MSTNTLSTKREGRCRECRGDLIVDAEAGEQVCTACGVVTINEPTVVANSVLPASDLGSIIGEASSSMVYDMGLPSIISDSNLDARGKHILEIYDMNRLRRLNYLITANDSKRRNLSKATGEIRRISDALGAGNPLAERAYEIYRKSLGVKGSSGRSISGMAGAAVYLACRELDIPRSAEDIQKLSESAHRNNIRRYSKIMMRETKMTISTPAPSSHISRIAGRAGLSGLTERKALRIIDQIKDVAVLAGKRPASIAAAALYLASEQTGEHITQIRIAFAAEITTITLRKRSSEISALLKEMEHPGQSPEPVLVVQ